MLELYLLMVMRCVDMNNPSCEPIVIGEYTNEEMCQARKHMLMFTRPGPKYFCQLIVPKEEI
jgi:hypothetical protein